MFKDVQTTPEINHRNDSDYKGMMKRLAEIVRSNERNSEEMRKVLGIPDGKNMHCPAHAFCDYENQQTAEEIRVTEKRICRCMYYYNRDNVSVEERQKCLSCDFPEKRKNISAYQIMDYEIPMPSVVKNAGGIDLLIKAPDGKYYATEVKPPKSKETLVRMAAEILTYCEISKYHVKQQETELGVEPAICFFEGSAQWNDYKTYRNTKDLQEMLKDIKVFYITYPKNGEFVIHDDAVEPI